MTVLTTHKLYVLRNSLHMLHLLLPSCIHSTLHEWWFTLYIPLLNADYKYILSEIQLHCKMHLITCQDGMKTLDQSPMKTMTELVHPFTYSRHWSKTLQRKLCWRNRSRRWGRVITCNTALMKQVLPKFTSPTQRPITIYNSIRELHTPHTNTYVPCLFQSLSGPNSTYTAAHSAAVPPTYTATRSIIASMHVSSGHVT